MSSVPPDEPSTTPGTPAAPAPAPSPQQHADTAVAVLLAVAAVIVAIVSGRAALVGDRGSDTWHQSVREEVKQAAGVVEDVPFL